MAQRVEGAGAQGGARRSEGPESREQGAGGQVSTVQTLCWGGRGERESALDLARSSLRPWP